MSGSHFYPACFLQEVICVLLLQFLSSEIFLSIDPCRKSISILLILCQANCNPLQTYLSGSPPSVRVFREASVRPLHNNTSTQTCCISLQTRLSTHPVPFQTCLSARLVNENWIQTTLRIHKFE